jgi:aldose 1-epimerase
MTPSSHAGPAPSGEQFRIVFGAQVATIAEVGAAVREYREGDRAVFQTYDEAAFSAGFHGAVLVPWPNRLADGRYTFDGEDLQVAVSEPARMTALHGLSPWRPWTPVFHDSDRVSLRLTLLPSPGYPFFVETVVDYRLHADGLRVTTTSRNFGDRACPYGIAFHPYLSGGGSLLDDCTLTLDAGRRFLTDERLLPIGEEDVAGTDYDFRQRRKLGPLVVDDAFTDVPRTAVDRLAWVRLGAPDGRTAAIWMDERCDYWQLCTGDMLPPQLARRGLAAEPMTAAPNAFQSGRGLLRIEPGGQVTTTWGACLQ